MNVKYVSNILVFLFEKKLLRVPYLPFSHFLTFERRKSGKKGVMGYFMHKIWVQIIVDALNCIQYLFLVRNLKFLEKIDNS